MSSTSETMTAFHINVYFSMPTFRWQKKPFSIGEDVALAQFHLADAGFGENIGNSGRRDRFDEAYGLAVMTL